MRTTYILGGIAALVLIGIVLSVVSSSREGLSPREWCVRHMCGDYVGHGTTKSEQTECLQECVKTHSQK